MRVLLYLLLVAGMATSIHAADWPCWRGPLGGGSATYDGALIDAPDQAKRVWKSEAVPVPTEGGYSSPVVADGKVYVYYYIGDGKLLDQAQLDKLKGRMSEERAKTLASPAANEVLLCVDAATGKTLWKFVSASTGLNYQGSNKFGGHFTPCVADGRVFVLGITGTLFCIDAATGERRWATDLAAFRAIRALRDECVKTAKVAPLSRARGGLPCSAPAVADGVVVVSDHSGYVGFDVETGKQLWRVAGSAAFDASPLTWTHEGKAYILGVGNLIDPKTGKECWRIAQTGLHGSGTPALAGDVVVYSGSRTMPASGWRLTPTKAEKLWQREPNEYVAGNHTSPGIHNGVAYLHCPSATGQQDKGYVLAVDMETGKELARHPGIWFVKLTTSVCGIGDRVMIVQCDEQFRLFGTGANFAELGTGAKWGSIYGNSTTPALADGFMYFRGTDALYCYDLRKPIEEKH